MIVLIILYQVAKYRMINSKLEPSQRCRIYISANFLLKVLLPVCLFGSGVLRRIVYE